ncbi:hypothetical protein DVS28_b0016 (plasmid) [Euzebya pacifica]|uniref:Uncharacterized protein n=1 Tax=Euzebya pacifica TaxID=1608957 RepID=A0A346Y5N9_9ACTN|nr:hypothetical protein [Euzebya pacifica]AXV09786.1 hypothetical protein DVS28_b0016 [Euzebya pacifica]
MTDPAAEPAEPADGRSSLLDLYRIIAAEGIDPTRVRVMRHTPSPDELARQIRWMAVEDPVAFTAFHCYQLNQQAISLRKADWLVSTLPEGRAAVFTGLFAIGAEQHLDQNAWLAKPGNDRLAAAGAIGPADTGAHAWFELTADPRLSDLIGRLEVGWPPARNWCRRLQPGLFPILAIHRENILASHTPRPS